MFIRSKKKAVVYLISLPSSFECCLVPIYSAFLDAFVLQFIEWQSLATSWIRSDIQTVGYCLFTIMFNIYTWYVLKCCSMDYLSCLNLNRMDTIGRCYCRFYGEITFTFSFLFSTPSPIRKRSALVRICSQGRKFCPINKGGKKTNWSIHKNFFPISVIFLASVSVLL